MTTSPKHIRKDNPFPYDRNTSVQDQEETVYVVRDIHFAQSIKKSQYLFASSAHTGLLDASYFLHPVLAFLALFP